MIEEVRIRPLATPALLLGIGLGGFIDGIVLHQLLQWHNMLSSVVPPTDLVSMKYNMIWDGAFHVAMWLVTLAGVVLLFRAARRDDVVWSGRILAGAMLAGWGLFNFVEGIVDHLVLGLHHVRPGESQLAWDIGFVAIGGIGLMLAGYWLGRSEISHDRMSPATRRALAL
jgi:uncharacterized membrane protein